MWEVMDRQEPGWLSLNHIQGKAVSREMHIGRRGRERGRETKGEGEGKRERDGAGERGRWRESRNTGFIPGSLLSTLV